MRGRSVSYVTPTILILIIVDMLAVALVDVWSTNRVVDMLFINSAFVLVLVSGFIKPQDSNSYICGSSNVLISGFYLIVELIVATILILLNIGTMWAATVQTALLLLTIAVIVANMSVNSLSAQKDSIIQDNHRMLIEIQNLLYNAFKNVEDNEVKCTIENAYDRSCSLSGYSISGLEQIDSNLHDMAHFILRASESGDLDTIKATCKSFLDLCDERMRIVSTSHRK